MPKPLLALALITLSLNTVAEDTHVECNNTCQKNLIQQYFSKLSLVFKKESDEAAITSLFTLFDPQVKYEHVEYQADFNLEAWKAAFNRNHKRGAYAAEKNSGLRVEQYIFGKQHVAVSYSYGMTSPDGKWIPKGDQNLFALFGFKGDKISLVREYW